MKRKLKGGYYLGQGNYGCVFSPPLTDIHGNVYGSNFIGKVMNTKDADLEYKAIKKFLDIDPESKYGVYGQKPELVTNDIDELIRSSDDQLEKCKESIQIQSQIVLERADNDLRKTLRPGELNIFKRHLFAFRNLLKGLALYDKYNLCHLDIKADNIVVFGSFENPKLYKFIDFGLSDTVADLSQNSDKLLTTLDTTYFVYPVTTTLWYQYKNSTEFKGDFDDPKWKTVFENLVKEKVRIESIPYLDFLPEMVYNPLKDTKNIMYSNHFERSLPMSKSDANTFRGILGKATDLYALGSILSQLCSEIRNVYYTENISGDGTFVSDYEAGPDGTLYDHIGDLMYQMMHFEVNAEGALVEFDLILNAFFPETRAKRARVGSFGD